jgi:hypothetical protein
MPENPQAEGSNPIGSDGIGGAANAPDVKKYHTFMVKSTKHLFNAPTDKYKDLLDVLGLQDVDSDDGKKETGLKLQQGTGFINLSVRVKGGATLRVVCDPDKVGTALKSAKGKKIYGKDIDAIRIPKKRIYI